MPVVLVIMTMVVMMQTRDGDGGGDDVGYCLLVMHAYHVLFL